MATQTKLVTYDDYRTLPDDGKRYEIIEGELYMTPAPTTLHQRISRKILVSLDHYVEKHQLGEVFDAPIDVVLSMTNVVQPDIVFVSKEQKEIITKKNIVAAPDLVVEILSESTETIDRTRKKTLYEKYGVKEYLMVDPDEKKIEQYVLQDGTFELNEKSDAPEKLDSKVIEGFTLDLEKIFTS